MTEPADVTAPAVNVTVPEELRDLVDAAAERAAQRWAEHRGLPPLD